MKAAVIDYGMGNLASVRRALEEAGASVSIVDGPEAIGDASHIVLPGVGAFRDAMSRIDAAAWPQRLTRAVQVEGIPLLGICLGMQLLADSGEEGGLTDGLGLVAGRVIRLTAPAGERIPHVGWNEVDPVKEAALFEGIPAGADFYFVHSYQFVPAEAQSELARTDYCGGFISAVGFGTVFGVQFHPEKSSRHGLRLLRNFLAIRGGTAC
jgi:imidazole glycerol-phosphate synthase subunit HisH